MKIKQFDVVELSNKEKAIIKRIDKNKNYLIEVISNDKTENKQRIITDKDIVKIVYSRKKDRIMGIS